MRRKITLFFLCILLVLPLHARRTVVSLDRDWYFLKGGIDTLESPLTDFSSWEMVDIPHDFSREGPYDENNPGGRQMGFLPAGKCCYKKVLAWDPSWEGRLLHLEFDGVFMNSTVWVNARKAGFRASGYSSFGYDVTPYMKEGDNVITVTVDNSLQPAARWYAGTGIYRPVRLVVTDKIYVPQWGTCVRTHDVSPEAASVSISAEICNAALSPAAATIQFIVLNSRGKTVASCSRDVVLPEGVSSVDGELLLPSPKLWSPSSPNLYTLLTRIVTGGAQVDEYPTTFGVRTIEFNTVDGFLLNGEKTIVNGVCIHQNFAPSGMAVLPDLWKRSLGLLKAAGCNAIRTAHHPFSPEFYDLCDSLGFLVLDEPWDGWMHWKKNSKAQYDYGLYFEEWWQRDLHDFIVRDRNHPCVFMWSLGNEVWGWQDHKDLQKQINDTFHAMDPTRPTTQAWATGDFIDIAGFNANGEYLGNIEEFHREQSDKVGIGTENPHTRSTRGVYRTIGAYNPWLEPTKDAPGPKFYPMDSYTEEEVFPEFDRRYASGYDNQAIKVSVRQERKQVLRYPYYVGDFRWTGFDYIGESWGFPARCCNNGILDLAGFPKDSYYLYKSFWSEKPMVHILPHWTWPGKEGVTIPVVAYTNCDEVELFQDGKSLGRKLFDNDALQIRWDVVYRPGKLKAVGYRNGKVAVVERVETAGEPAVIRISVDRRTARANRKDLFFFTVDILDSKGNLVPWASNLVKYDITGPYKLEGVENGDILDNNPPLSMESKAFMGKTLLAVRTTGRRGLIRVTATGEGLRRCRKTVLVRK